MRRRELGGPLEEVVAGLVVARERLKPGHERLQVRELRGRATDPERVVGEAVRAEEPCAIRANRSAQRGVGLSYLEGAGRSSRSVVPVPILVLVSDAGGPPQAVRPGL